MKIAPHHMSEAYRRDHRAVWEGLLDHERFRLPIQMPLSARYADFDDTPEMVDAWYVEFELILSEDGRGWAIEARAGEHRFIIHAGPFKGSFWDRKPEETDYSPHRRQYSIA